MSPIDALLSLPTEGELWIILAYVGGVLLGARAVEALARVHFARARRHGERGLEYVEAEDHYQCPEAVRA